MRWRNRSVPEPGSTLEPNSRETQYLVSSGDGSTFFVQIEPEGMMYEFPPHERVLLTFRQQVPRVQHMELTHYKDALVIWRHGDTEVWATVADGPTEQIAGWAHNPAPWIDSNSKATGAPPWSWPPPPPTQDDSTPS
jgi:hypothetical protein